MKNQLFAVTAVLVGAALVGHCRVVDAEAAPSFRGTVFLDNNANGVRDGDEVGLPKVAVTDGVGIVQTNAQGHYEISLQPDPLVPHDKVRTISVSWPEKTWPVNRGPAGRWWYRLSEVKQGQSLDFALRPDRQERPFAFGQVTDNHDNGAMYRRFAQEAEAMQPFVKFFVNTGDLMYANYDSDMSKVESKYKQYVENASRMPMPVFHAVGNHDYAGTDSEDADPDDPRYALGVYTRFLGPPRWSFTYAGTHFAGVDWAYLRGTHYESGVADVASKWLDRDLALAGPNTTKFVFAHFPSGQSGFWPVLVKHRVAMALGGHSHRYMRFAHGGILAGTTLNLRGNGACAIGIVDDEYVEVIDRCAGCKSDPNYHSKHCAIAWHKKRNTHVGSRGEHRRMTDVRLADGAQTITGIPSKDLEAAVEISPGTAKQVGIRIRPTVSLEEPFEIGCHGNELVAGYLRIPMAIVPRGRLEQLHVVIRNGVAEVYVNNGVKLTVRSPLTKPSSVELIATGGAAIFDSVEVWKLK